MSRVASLLVAAIWAMSIAQAQGTNRPSGELRRAPILGVYDAQSGSPIQGALVRDTLGNEARTTITGTVSLDYVVPVAGFYLIEIRKGGFAPIHRRIRVDSLTHDLTEVLQPAPLGDTARAQHLPTVTVNGEVITADWKIRCSDGGCILPGVLKDSIYAYKTIGEALGMNGIRLQQGRRSRGGSCGVQLLVNGAKSVLDLSVNAQIFTAAEFYTSALMTPEQFRRADGKACGTLVLWTFSKP